MSEPLVFVVDDDPSARRGMARLLRAEGHRVEELSSADAFIDREPNLDGPSCCLVLDLRMPGMNGLELQERLHDRGHGVPIVFVTGHGDVPSSVRALKGGAIDYLLKPFSDNELVEAVEVALERRRWEVAEQHEHDEIVTRWSRLTPREREVMALVVEGLLNKQVAGRLGITEKTVKVHRAQVMAKMEAGSLAELVRMDTKLGPEAPPNVPGEPTGGTDVQ